MLDTILTSAETYGAMSLFICLVLCSFGLPLAKSLIIVAGGILAGLGKEDPILLFAACSLGLHGGDFLLFLIGRHYGESAFQARWVRYIAPVQQVEKARCLIARYGSTAIIMARITPFIRSLCYLTLGSLRMKPGRFFTFNYLVAAVYTGIFFFIGFIIGNHPEKLQRLVRSGNIIFIFAALTVITGLLIFKRANSMSQPGEATLNTGDESGN